jgi:anti-sigma B factor antagonist
VCRPSPDEPPVPAALRVDVLRAPAPPAARIRATGELDLATAPRLQTALRTLLDSGYAELDLDLHELAFCDVAGLNVLLQARDAAVAAGGRLTVHGNCRPLVTMLHVLRLERAFEQVRRDGEPGGNQA